MSTPSISPGEATPPPVYNALCDARGRGKAINVTGLIARARAQQHQARRASIVGIPERNLPYVTVSPVGADADPRRSAALARTPNTSQAGATPPIASAAAGPPAPGPSRRR